jgi:hydrogenase maturation factor
MHKTYPLGKLPAAHLARLLGQHPITDPRVIVGPRVGQDVAVLEVGERYLVAKSDPITFATDAIGWYAVHVNANDVACSGASPRWFLATLLLPEGRADAALVEDIMNQITRACQEIGASLVGGHTEITYGLQRPIVIGSMLGQVSPERLVTTSGARPGDAVLLTRRVAVEATAIIAQEKRDELLDQHDLDKAYVDRCADFIHDPGISVVRAAQIAASVAPVHAMHDPTEGGLSGGLWELAQAASVGLEIDLQAVPVYAETRALCEVYGLDPWGVIASGSLLLTLDPPDARPVCAALDEAGIEASVIGRVLPPASGVRTSAGQALPSFARDEIARLFE